MIAFLGELRAVHHQFRCKCGTVFVVCLAEYKQRKGEREEEHYRIGCACNSGRGRSIEIEELRGLVRRGAGVVR